jgi:hypothetical protein
MAYRRKERRVAGVTWLFLALALGSGAVIAGRPAWPDHQPRSELQRNRLRAVFLFGICETVHIPVASTRARSIRHCHMSPRCPAMNRSSSIAAFSTDAPKESIARSYLQLLRLRQLVHEAERSLSSDGANTPRGSRFNPQRGHRA